MTAAHRCVINPLPYLAAALAMVAGCGSALAQYAHGDGRSMQKNTDRYKDKEPIRTRDLRSEVQFRNAVVTGNAPGGASFRGATPYAGDKDFRGSLGSDNLYRFRRDSTASGYNGTGLRGTQSLQYQFGLQTGSTVSPSVNRLESGLPSSAATTDAARQLRSASERLRSAFEALSPSDIASTSSASASSFGATRSTSAFAASRGLQPVYIGDRIATDGRLVARVTASSLLGMKNIRSAAPASAIEPAGGIPTGAVGTRPENALAAGSAAAGSASSSVPNISTPAVPKPTRSIVDEARDNLRKSIGAENSVAGGPDLLEERLDAIRRDLSGLPPKPGAPDVSGPAKPDVAWLRPTAPLMKSYVTVDRSPTDLYSIHMDAGQKLAVAERFFDAEERFAKALTARQGDPTAQVARIHAQTMAGMFVSAAVNLRTLIITHPEVVGIQFDESLLPRGGRTAAIKGQCRTIIERVRAGNTDRFTRDTGLVLAYLGYLTQDREARIDGLWALSADAKSVDGQSDQRLAAFLEKVWNAGEPPMDFSKPSLPPVMDPSRAIDPTK